VHYVIVRLEGICDTTNGYCEAKLRSTAMPFCRTRARRRSKREWTASPQGRRREVPGRGMAGEDAKNRRTRGCGLPPLKTRPPGLKTAPAEPSRPTNGLTLPPAVSTMIGVTAAPGAPPAG